VKSIDQVSKKALYIQLDSKKGQWKKGQEETNKKKLKKIVTTAKNRFPNRNCKHCDVDEKC
jgi:hypothetical protein